MSADPANIAILLTPPGSGAIAVIRLSGPLNTTFVQQHFSRPAKAGRCVYGDLRDGEDVIDDIVAVETPDGALDLNIHGGPWVTQAVMNLAERFGYVITPWRVAPGVAFDAADDVERQVLVDLPSARSALLLRLLTAQPAAWRQMLADDDKAAMRRAIDDRALETALAVPTVAIVGPPNVGKSTLANALFGQARSITADLPGTTRDWVGELADLDGLVVRLVDTPGVRATVDPIEAAAIERAGPMMAAARCVVLVIDGSRATDAEARAAIEHILSGARANGQPVVPIFSKADLPAGRANPGRCIRVSAATGQGIDGLRDAIRAALGVADLITPTARCWTAAQRDGLRQRLGTPAAGI